MALILLSQKKTGFFLPDEYGYEQPEVELIHFNPGTISLQYTMIYVDTDEFELEEDQMFFDDAMGTQYFYDGNGGFYTGATPVSPQYTLTIQATAGGSATDLSNTPPYSAAESVNLSATADAGFVFRYWTRNGVIISYNPAFTFTMPAGNVMLVAWFMDESEVPTPEPQTITESFYPLELRLRGIQIPMPPFVEKLFTNMLNDGLDGDHSHAVNIPLLPELMIALGNPNDPQSSANFQETIPAEIWSHGNLKFPGHLDILKSDENQIRASFILDSGFFIVTNSELKISDCYPLEEVINLDTLPRMAVGGYEIRFYFDDWKLQVNAFSKSFLRAEFPTQIAQMEAMKVWLLGLGIGLEVKIEYSDDTDDELSRLIYWDTTTVTSAFLIFLRGTLTPNVEQYARCKKLTSLRIDTGVYANVDPLNRIAFPSVYNRELYEGNNTAHDGVVNRYDDQGRLHYTNPRYESFSEAYTWENVIVPYLYLTDIVRQIFKHLQVQVDGDFFENDLVQRMLVYNNRTLDFIQVYLDGVPTERTAEAVNEGDYNPNQFGYSYANIHNLAITLANHTPQMTVVDFLKRLRQYFGLKYDFFAYQNKVSISFTRTKIHQRQPIDLTRFASRLFVVDHGKNTGLKFTYQDPDPLMEDGAKNSVSELVQDHMVQNFLALDGLDAEIGEIALVQSLQAYFQLTTNQEEAPYWKLYAFIQQSDVTLSGVEGGSDAKQSPKQSWNVGAVPMVDGFITGRKMPAIEVTANNPEVNLTNMEFGLRLMAFYGMQNDGNDRPYAFASCTAYNAKEILSESQYFLHIRSADIYPWHSDIERILTAAKKYECDLLLDEYHLKQLSRNPIIRLGNLEYLVDELEIQSTAKELNITRAQLVKLK